VEKNRERRSGVLGQEATISNMVAQENISPK
jgi:hypothetical protein